jgi:hypothetical protein
LLDRHYRQISRLSAQPLSVDKYTIQNYKKSKSD